MSRARNRPWTEPERALLRRRYADTPTKVLSQRLGRPEAHVYSQAAHLGLRKSAAYLDSAAAARLAPGTRRGTGTRFEKGCVPWNKGLKGWCPPGSQATQFVPGVHPPNTLPLGALRITRDGTLERKYSEAPGNPSARWRSEHRLVWEAAHGPVRRGWIVVFKPGQRTNVAADITLDRLECITWAENLRRNGQSQPIELRRLTQLKGAINRQVNRINREARERQQAA